MKIEKTFDYEKFTLINGNRTISARKVEKIVSDVKNGLDLFPYCPIIIDPGYRIIDGQHRFTAAKKLGMPIYHIVAENITLRNIAQMNSNSDKWSLRDFLECYVKLGNEHYVTLKEFCDEYRISIRHALPLLSRGSASGGGRDSERFKDGEFEVKFYERSQRIVSLVDRFFGKFVFNRDRNLMDAVATIMDKELWDLDVMDEKIKKNPRLMNQQTTAKNYTYLIEQIYNFGNKNRKSIF